VAVQEVRWGKVAVKYETWREATTWKR